MSTTAQFYARGNRGMQLRSQSSLGERPGARPWISVCQFEVLFIILLGEMFRSDRKLVWQQMYWLGGQIGGLFAFPFCAYRPVILEVIRIPCLIFLSSEKWNNDDSWLWRIVKINEHLHKKLTYYFYFFFLLLKEYYSFLYTFFLCIKLNLWSQNVWFITLETFKFLCHHLKCCSFCM